jgi:hypothetical protein
LKLNYLATKQTFYDRQITLISRPALPPKKLTDEEKYPIASMVAKCRRRTKFKLEIECTKNGSNFVCSKRIKLG